MRLYKSTLTLGSASATLWQADTIFGHLCWKLLRRGSEAELNKFLELYEQGQPPILLSDGFPGNYLPRPLAPSSGDDQSQLTKRERVERRRVANGHLDEVRNFLNELQATGYGKRKTVGYGRIESFTLEEFDGFTEVPDADGFVTLSRFVPAPADPTDGFWRAVVKYGKLGEE